MAIVPTIVVKRIYEGRYYCTEIGIGPADGVVVAGLQDMTRTLQGETSKCSFMLAKKQLNFPIEGGDMSVGTRVNLLREVSDGVNLTCTAYGARRFTVNSAPYNPFIRSHHPTRANPLAWSWCAVMVLRRARVRCGGPRGSVRRGGSAPACTSRTSPVSTLSLPLCLPIALKCSAQSAGIHCVFIVSSPPTRQSLQCENRAALI